MTDEKAILDYVSDIDELNEMSKYMDDPVVSEAMGYVVKLSVKENVPLTALPALIVKLQAISGILSLKAKYYTVYEKGPESSKRKNTYYTLADTINNLCNALKYGAK